MDDDDWRVTISFPDSAQAQRAKILFPRRVVRRWKFLVIGASNEDDARELADQVRREASADATVRAGHSAVYLPFAGF
jgi:hypothetical protein